MTLLLRGALALTVTAPVLLAACAGPLLPADELPTLSVRVEPQPTLRDLDASIEVVFVNTAQRTFTVQSPGDCLRLEALVRTQDGVAVAVDDPGQVRCGDGSTNRVRAGESLEWGLRFVPGEWRDGAGEYLFGPGTYALEVDVQGDASWPVQNETVLEIQPGELPAIEILPEKEQWPQGEENRIALVLENTAPVPFEYTSRDGCRDIRVRVMETEARLWPANGTYACPEVLTEYTLEPGESLHWEVVWDGSLDGDGGPPYGEGHYHLEADLGAVDSDWSVTSSARVTILKEE